MARLAGILLVALAVYGALLAALWFGQERLIFRPTPLGPDQRWPQTADIQERFVEVPGARLWALHLTLPDPRGVVFYLHGNAGNLASWFVNADFYRAAGYDLFMIDYRGYGKSSGRIESQAQLEADVRAAWTSIAPRYAGKRRVFFGRSLGSGLAAMLAAEVQPELTVLVSPYFSLIDLGREHYPWVPSTVLRYPMRSDLALPRVRGEVLIAHGEIDTVIPAEHGRRLAALAPRARLLIVPGAGHNDIQVFEPYLDGLRQALAKR